MIAEDGSPLGIMKIEEARRLAIEQGLDLIEVTAAAVPPVVKILDYGKFLYQLKKDDRKTRAKSKGGEMKEVRISLRIGTHDLQVKVERAKKFLAEGDRVKANLRFRGRENAHKELGFERMREFVTLLGEDAVVEQPAKVLGNILICIIRAKA